MQKLSDKSERLVKQLELAIRREVIAIAQEMLDDDPGPVRRARLKTQTAGMLLRQHLADLERSAELPKGE